MYADQDLGVRNGSIITSRISTRTLPRKATNVRYVIKNLHLPCRFSIIKRGIKRDFFSAKFVGNIWGNSRYNYTSVVMATRGNTCATCAAWRLWRHRGSVNTSSSTCLMMKNVLNVVRAEKGFTIATNSWYTNVRTPGKPLSYATYAIKDSATRNHLLSTLGVTLRSNHFNVTCAVKVTSLLSY